MGVDMQNAKRPPVLRTREASATVFRRRKHGRSMVAEHDVENAVREWEAFSVALDKCGAPDRLSCRACVSQLLLGQIHPNGAGAGCDQPESPLSCASLIQVHAVLHRVENFEFRFWNTPDAPGQGLLSERQAMGALVGITPQVPDRAISFTR